MEGCRTKKEMFDSKAQQKQGELLQLTEELARANIELEVLYQQIQSAQLQKEAERQARIAKQ